jgi:hypothetical protein
MQNILIVWYKIEVLFTLRTVLAWIEWMIYIMMSSNGIPLVQGIIRLTAI